MPQNLPGNLNLPNTLHLPTWFGSGNSVLPNGGTQNSGLPNAIRLPSYMNWSNNGKSSASSTDSVR